MAASTPLKVVIMSATLDCKAITDYFRETMDSNLVAGDYVVGTTEHYNIHQYFIDQLISLAGRPMHVETSNI